ncbi:MAG: DNA alkylation repair protein [Candidatus Heimdallarchaeaceae archaeon]|jgi:3-methyladenine DNA glycosylase AlkD
MNREEILKELKSFHDPSSVEGMKRGGINPDKVFGVKIPILRKMAKKIKTNHDLAQELWDLGYRETMILAAMIDDPDQVTEEQMEKWVISKYFSYWEVVDQTCMNLFFLTKFAYEKAIEWSSRTEEFVKRAAFALMAVLAWKDKKAENNKFETFFTYIKKESVDDRNNVKKAVNWALRQIGKRNLSLNMKACKIAKEILEIESKSSKWIARDAIKELESDAIQKRLRE